MNPDNCKVITTTSCPYEKPCGKKPCDDGGACPKDCEWPYRWVPYYPPYVPTITPDPYPYYPTPIWIGVNDNTTCSGKC